MINMKGTANLYCQQTLILTLEIFFTIIDMQNLKSNNFNIIKNCDWYQVQHVFWHPLIIIEYHIWNFPNFQFSAHVIEIIIHTPSQCLGIVQGVENYSEICAIRKLKNHKLKILFQEEDEDKGVAFFTG